MKNLLLFCIVIFIIPCNTDKKNTSDKTKNEGFQTFEFDVENCRDNNFSDYFEISRVIPLETTDASLIKYISNTHINGEEILIFDRELKKLFLFDREGKFIRQIGRNGKGPGEYIKINDFATTINHDTISIYDEKSQGILRYNKKGEFLGKVKIGSYFGSMEIWKNKKFVMFNRNTIFFPKDEKISNFCVFNSQGKLLHEDIFYSHSELAQTYKIRYNDLYQLKDGSINVQEFFNDTIFIYNGDRLIPRFYFDFKEYALPLELKNSFLEQSHGDYEVFIKKVDNTNLMHNWGSIWFENNDIIATTRHRGKEALDYIVFIDKRNGQHFIFKRFDQNFMWRFLPRLLGITQNCNSNELVFVIPAYEVKYLRDNDEQYLKKYKQEYPQEWSVIEEAISKVKLEDNPLLVFAKLKDYKTNM
ncbi:MAG: hypothetical protein CSA36_04105 [Draconibacterium sp.]|nr:MAG: hypothetical protein CSA36_04105 [Draconibacterium sp.]